MVQLNLENNNIMKVFWGKLVLWVITLIVWIGGIGVVKYAVTQMFSKDVATGQFDQYTNSYKILRASNTIETVISVVGLVVVLFIIYRIFKCFKIKKIKKT